MTNDAESTMPEREPLTPTESRAWQHLVALTTHLPAALDTQLERESGVTHFEYRVLEALSLAPGGQLQLVELANKTNASLSRLSNVLRTLEGLNLIRRDKNRGRAGRCAALTADGHAAVQKIAPVYLNAVRGLVFDGLDEGRAIQLHQLLQLLLRQVATGIDQGIGLRPGTANRARFNAVDSEAAG